MDFIFYGRFNWLWQWCSRRQSCGPKGQYAGFVWDLTRPSSISRYTINSLLFKILYLYYLLYKLAEFVACYGVNIVIFFVKKQRYFYVFVGVWLSFLTITSILWSERWCVWTSRRARTSQLYLANWLVGNKDHTAKMETIIIAVRATHVRAMVTRNTFRPFSSLLSFRLVLHSF